MSYGFRYPRELRKARVLKVAPHASSSRVDRRAWTDHPDRANPGQKMLLKSSIAKLATLSKSDARDKRP
jgi:hypothetical protein